MTEFAFFDNKEDRWDDSMWAHWGNVSICPCHDHVELPYHTLGNYSLSVTSKFGGMLRSPITVWPIS